MIFLLVGCSNKSINEYDATAIGIITNKKYTPASSTVYCGKSYILQPRTNIIPAKYEITITVDNMFSIINNEILYNKYEIGDSVEVILNYKEYKNGGTISVKITSIK